MKSTQFFSVLLAKLLLLGGASLGDARAAELVQCDGCNADQMELAFYNVVNQAPVPTENTVYVANYQTGQVRKWTFRKYYDDVQWYCDPRHGPTPYECLPWTDAEEFPVESEVQLYVDYVNAYAGIEVQILPGSAFGGLPQDGYELVESAEARRRVSEWISINPIQAIQTFRDVVALVPILGLNPGNVGMRVTIVAPDGSRHSFKYNPDRPEPFRWELEPRTSRDPNGNPIPETREEVYGGIPGGYQDYDFTGNPETLIDWLARMENLGVRITGPIGDPDDAKFRCSNRVERGPNGEERVVVECKRQ